MVFVCIRTSLHSVRFGQLLRCVRKHFVNMMKVYIERNNMQVELIRFRKKLATLLTLETLKWEYGFANAVFTILGSLLSGTNRHCSVLGRRTFRDMTTSVHAILGHIQFGT